VISKAGLGSLRIYVASTNLLYLFGDDYTSYNPEGIEITNSGYLGPTTSGSFTFGVNLNF